LRTWACRRAMAISSASRGTTKCLCRPGRAARRAPDVLCPLRRGRLLATCSPLRMPRSPPSCRRPQEGGHSPTPPDTARPSRCARSPRSTDGVPPRHLPHVALANDHPATGSPGARRRGTRPRLPSAARGSAAPPG
jgi:hypothetical protein